MLHYYFLKYGSRMIVGTMVGMVLIVFGLFSYSLTAGFTPATITESASNQETYQKSVSLFGKIQELKQKKQDTTKLEALYTESVKNLSSQHQSEAEDQLEKLEVQIGIISESLEATPSPKPSEVLSGTPAPSEAEPSTTLATKSAELE